MLLGGILSRVARVAASARESVLRLGERTLMRALKTYYAVKDFVQKIAGAEAEPISKGLRTPVARLVEFYAAMVWAGPIEDALPIDMKNTEAEKAAKKKTDKADDPESARDPEPILTERTADAIRNVWEWSELDRRTSMIIRRYAMLGEMFLKVSADVSQEMRAAASVDPDAQDAPRADRVFIQSIDPADVTTVRLDKHRAVIYLRIDILEDVLEDGERVGDKWHTEIWNLEEVRIWKHDQGIGATTEQLGVPQITMTLEEVGTPGMIPIVYSQFIDVGDPRGMPAFWTALDKIDESDALATRLHQILFRFQSVMWALEYEPFHKDMSPIAQPQAPARETDESGSVKFGDEEFLVLPGTLKCLVPELDYEAMRHAVEDMVVEMEKSLPELQYYSITTNADLAVETMRMMLAPAFARAAEVRGNANAALAHADTLALIMAQHMELPGFASADIGTFESGDFRHSFGLTEFMPVTPKEQADLDFVRAQADETDRTVGVPFRTLMGLRGYSEEEIAEMEMLQEAERATDKTFADVLVEETRRRFDAGEGGVAVDGNVSGEDGADGTEGAET